MPRPTLAAPVAADLTILQLLDSYRLTLAAADRSPKTIQLYALAVRKLVAFLEAQGMPTTIGGCRREHVEEWIAALRREPSATTGKPLAASTILTWYLGVDAFFSWCVEENEIPVSPMERMRVPRIVVKPPRVLTDDECRQLLKGCEGTDWQDRRDLAILRLFLATGMRISELANLRVADLDLQGENVARVIGKGRKERICPFDAKTARALDRYLRRRSVHPAADRPALWLGRMGPLTADRIYEVVAARGKQAGVKVHPHEFRHKVAHDLLAAGLQEGDVMRLLGWSSRKMLDRYAANTADARARAAYRRLQAEGGDRF